MSDSGTSSSSPHPPRRPSTNDAERVRALFDSFVAALTAHLGAVERRRGETDGAVFAGYERLREAFTAYDEALYDTYDEVTPFVVVEDEDEDDTDLDEDDEDDADDDLDADEDEDDTDLDGLDDEDIDEDDEDLDEDEEEDEEDEEGEERP